MLTNKLLASLLVVSVLGLTGCGATDSGHADNQHSSSSSIEPGDGGGSDVVIQPEITGQPVAQSSAYAFESIQLSVEAIGTSVEYQWQKAIDNAWVDLRGEDAPQISFGYLTDVDSGLYRVAVSNAAGVIHSNTAQLLVKENLEIDVQPESSMTRNEGSSADFEVSAIGEGAYYYQWYKGAAALTDSPKFMGAETAHLTVYALTTSDAGSYSVEVTNDDGKKVVSSTAYLAVNGPARISSNPVSVTKAEGSPASFAVSAGGTAPITYQWEVKKNGVWRDVAGANSASLGFSGVTPSDAGEYRCRVNNSVNSPDYSDSAVLSVNSPVVITSQPVSVYGGSHRVAENTRVTYSVSAAGTDVGFSWFEGGKKVADGATLDLGSVSSSDAGTYTCKASNMISDVNCSPVTLTVLTPASISTHPGSQEMVAGQPGSLSVSASGTAPFSYQWQKNSGSGWVDVSGGTGSTLSFASVSVDDAAEYRARVNNELNQLVASSVATVTVIERVAITQQPSDAYGAEYRGVLGESLTLSVSATGTDVEYSWYKNNAPIGSGSSVQLSGLKVSDAGVYRCEVSNSQGSASCANVEIVILTPPSILSQPNDITVFEGANVALNIQVSGSPVPDIQWSKDGEVLSGKVASTLGFGAISLEDEGVYTCEVTNEASSVSCNPVTIEVKEVVRIVSSPSNQVLSDGSSAVLSVLATGEAPLTFTWYKDGSVLESGTGLSSINLLDVTSLDEGAYQVVVSNEGSDATSSAAQITVLEPIGGTALISWGTPQERSDSSALDGSEIQGYKVYRRLGDGSFEEVAYVLVSEGNSAEIDDLEVGVHYFALTTIDVSGMESDLSDVVGVTISAQ